MSESIKRIALLSASPKVDQEWAVSNLLAQRGESMLKNEQSDVVIIPVRHALTHHETASAFDLMQEADAIVMIFPLYFFCLPAMLTRFLQDFAVQRPKATKACAVYAIVNCGFPEPEINQEAMRVVEMFARQTGRSYGGGVMIGCGGMVLGAQGAPFMKPVMASIDDLFVRVKCEAAGQDLIEVQIAVVAPKFPRKLYFLAGNAGWRSSARKNHLKSKDLYRAPYQSK
ncbi:MAG: flavodoxin [Clostridiaceae bacterium]